MSGTVRLAASSRLDDGAIVKSADPRPAESATSSTRRSSRLSRAAAEPSRVNEPSPCKRDHHRREQGPHFSFGASVEEHLPETCSEDACRISIGLFKDAAFESARGRYIAVGPRTVPGWRSGAGIVLPSSICGRRDARLGQPEIKLGVFAPVASVVLPMRVGQAAADDLLLTGRTIDAEDGLRIGLVDEIHEDPHEAAISYARDHFLPKSAASLALAVRAARAGFERVVSRTHRHAGADVPRRTDEDDRRRRGHPCLPRQTQTEMDTLVRRAGP